MKKLIPLLMLALSLGVACQTKTPQKIAVDTLTSIGQAGNDAFEGYLASVLQGSTPTNDVPKIKALYAQFQAAYGAAAAGAHFATNSVLAGPELQNAFSQLATAISVIQKGGK